MKLSLIKGCLLNPISDKRCQKVQNGALLIKDIGKNQYKIISVGTYPKLKKLIPRQASLKEFNFSDSILMPAFLDIHFHWVQDAVREMPKALLMDWLKNYTWPFEKKFEHKEFSKKMAKEFSTHLLQVGTLGGACYSSIHEVALNESLKNFIGDFVIGNVLMTMNSPDELLQHPQKAIKLVEKMVVKHGSKYALTPRFALSTDPHVMQETAHLAKRKKIFIQSHLSENKFEIELVLKTFRQLPGFEDCPNYTEIYNRCGILGDRTIMGHGIHLSAEELKILKKTKTIIAHCPTSNAPTAKLGLGSGLFDFRRTEKANVRWGLASDIGGGPYLSMFDVIRSFVEQNSKKKISEATYTKALYRSTLMNAKILKLENQIGNFSVGKWANFIVVPNFANQNDDAEEMIKKICLSVKNDRNKYDHLVEKTFYRGRCVYSKNSAQ